MNKTDTVRYWDCQICDPRQPPSAVDHQRNDMNKTTKITPETLAARDGVEHVLVAYAHTIDRGAYRYAGDVSLAESALSAKAIMGAGETIDDVRVLLPSQGRTIIGHRGPSGTLAIVTVVTGHPVNKSIRRSLRALADSIMIGDPS